MTNPEEINTDPTDEAREIARRQTVVDRRSGLTRRRTLAPHGSANPALADEQAAPPDELSAGEFEEAENLTTNLERRRGPGRRRTDFMKSAEEGEMTQEQFMFVMAIDAFKRVNARTFPTWTEVLEVIRKLGYRKTCASELNLGRRVEDWTEPSDAPAGVFKQTPTET